MTFNPPEAGRDTRSADQGFTIVEVSIAIAIFAVVGIVMAGMMSLGLQGLLHSRQRTVATADANQLLEAARTLDFENLGLAPGDPTLDTDPAVTTNTATDRRYNGERIVFAQDPAGHPFSPHCQVDISRDPTTLVRHIYVTGIDTTGNSVPDLKRVTVVVSWQRPGLASGAPSVTCSQPPGPGASNAITTSTVIAPHSPGTPGNPPLGVTSFPPLFGVASVKGFQVDAEGVVGPALSLGQATPSVMRYTGPTGRGDNRLDANSRISCTQGRASLQGEGPGAVTQVGGATATASADSVSNPGPFSQTDSANVATVGVDRPPLHFVATVGSGTDLVGDATCTADGTTSPIALPRESGSSTTSGGRAIRANTAGALLPGLPLPIGDIRMVDLSGSTATQSVGQTEAPNRRMTSTATHSLDEVRLMRPEAGTTLAPLMPDGLVWVSAYESSVSALAHTEGGTPSFTPSATKPLKVRVWDGNVGGVLSDGQGTPITCLAANRFGNYCEFGLPLSADVSINASREFCASSVLLLGCVLTARVDTVVTLKRPVMQTFSPDGGATQVYQASYSPLVVVTRLTLVDRFGVVQTDLRTALDLGRIDACARYGIFPGGC